MTTLEVLLRMAVLNLYGVQVDMQRQSGAVQQHCATVRRKQWR